KATDTAWRAEGRDASIAKMRRPEAQFRVSRTRNSGGPAKQPRSRVFSARHPPRPGEGKTKETTGEPRARIKTGASIALAAAPLRKKDDTIGDDSAGAHPPLEGEGRPPQAVGVG